MGGLDSAEIWKLCSFLVVLMSHVTAILLLPLSFFQAQEEFVFLALYKRLCTMALLYRSNHVKVESCIDQR
jgi:hypothetical protein